MRAAAKWRWAGLGMMWASGCIDLPPPLPLERESSDGDSTTSGAAESSDVPLTTRGSTTGTEGVDSSSTSDGDSETTESPSPPECGNGRAEDGEGCDGMDWRGATCESLGFSLGALECSNCQFDATGCGPVVGVVEIPGGPFDMGALDERNEQPIRTVQVDTFFIDEHEVTVADYRNCVTAGECDPPGTTDDCNWMVEGMDDHPINCVRWGNADNYCSWVNVGLKRLPTEAEWEKAARGMGGVTYPWGEVPLPSCSHVVMNDPAVEGPGCGNASTMPVGSTPMGASPYGVLDMAGNVREFVADWYDVGYNPVDTDNPSGPINGTSKVVRGGAWRDELAASTFRGAARDFLNTGTRDAFSGFRCAMSPQLPPR